MYYTSVVAINIGMIVAITAQGFTTEMKRLRNNYIMRKILLESGGKAIIYGTLLTVFAIATKNFDNTGWLFILLCFEFYTLWKTRIYDN